MAFTPLDVAEMLDRVERDGGNARALRRDPRTGLYICEVTEPPTELTLPQYEAGLKVLDMRDRAQRG